MKLNIESWLLLLTALQILTLVLSILKVLGVVTLGWMWILIPVAIPLVLTFILTILVFVIPLIRGS